MAQHGRLEPDVIYKMTLKVISIFINYNLTDCVCQSVIINISQLYVCTYWHSISAAYTIWHGGCLWQVAVSFNFHENCLSG